MRAPRMSSLLVAAAFIGLAPAALAQVPHAPRRAPARPAADPNDPTRVIEPAGFALRPIDRATVRLVAISGMGGRIMRSRSGSNRLVAEPRASHGSGLILSPDGLVLTARHVVAGADVLAAIFPGQRTAVPATVVYVDPGHDLAFVRVQTTRPLADLLALPSTLARLMSGQGVSVTGYPLDPQERYPAAVSGQLARVNNDGRLQLSITVNHGNSGGPVFDTEGHLLGVVSARGEPEQGVEGITLVEPIQYAVEARRRLLPAMTRRTFGADDARVAQSVFDLLWLDPDRDDHDPVSADRVLALATVPLSPEATCVVAAQAWNEALFVLESNRAADVSALSPERRTRVETLVRVARDLHLRAVSDAPYLRSNYDFAYLFERIGGALVAPALSPERESESAAGVPLGADATTNATTNLPPPPPPDTAPPASGAVAKLNAFLQRNLRLAQAPPSGAARVIVRLRLSPSGALVSGGLSQGTGDAATDAQVTAQLRALVERHPRIESLTPVEVAELSGRDTDVAVPLSAAR